MARCGHCNEERDEYEYGIRDGRTGRTHTICRACRRGYSRKHYWTNHAKYTARKRQRLKACRERNRSFVATYLENRQCVDCGLVDALVMEFDHVHGKKVADISTMMHDAVPLHILQQEIGKCVVRCANCHRRRTAITLWGRPAWPKQGFAGTMSD